jgi:hypothetical protein
VFLALQLAMKMQHMCAPHVYLRVGVYVHAPVLTVVFGAAAGN